LAEESHKDIERMSKGRRIGTKFDKNTREMLAEKKAKINKGRSSDSDEHRRLARGQRSSVDFTNVTCANETEREAFFIGKYLAVRYN